MKLKRSYFSRKITSKIIALVLFVAFLIGLSLEITFYSITNKNTKEDSANLEQLMNENFDLLLKDEVQTVYTLIESIYKEFQEGKINEEQAKEKALNIINDLRFGKDGYFWINDTQLPIPNMIIHATSPQLNGKLLDNQAYNLVGEEKRNLFGAMVDVCMESGEGYVKYLWPKPGKSKPQPKRSYVKLFNEWNWIIGTGNYVDDIKDYVNVQKAKKYKQMRKTMLLFSSIIIILLIIASLSAIIIGRRISKPLIKLSRNVKKIAEGDLSVKINTSQKDEVGILAKSIENMIKKLRETIEVITQGSTHIVSASGQLNATAEQISQGVNEQAAASEEISSSMEEMVATVEQNTQNANQTDKIANEVSNEMKRFSNAVEDTAKAMNEISEKILVINEIAARTDLLAVNAAIEAARAGEKGKGFAVVASEIRALAEKSQQSAVEIENLSTKSIHTTEELNDILNQLAPNILKTANLVQEINAASQEQNANANQVNSAVQQLVDVTQQSSAVSEQLASSSAELESQAERLLQSVSFFSLESKSDEELIKELMEQRSKLDGLIDKVLNKNKLDKKKNYSSEDKPEKEKTKEEVKNKDEVKIDLDDELGDDYEEFK